MLNGIDPLLTGELLKHLDEMGHSDIVVAADAHFPAARLGARVVSIPGIGTPRIVRALTSVLPLDNSPRLELMASADGAILPVQAELMRAAAAEPDRSRFTERFAFYDLAAGAYLIVRSGETRVYANALLRKGVTEDGEAA